MNLPYAWGGSAGYCRGGKALAAPYEPRISGLERLEKRIDQQARTESKTQLVEQINSCLHSGQYSRAMDLVRGAVAEFPNDAQLLELEKFAHDGVERNAEAQRLITESQELFAQQKSSQALQLLRQAYELDKKNSLARSILANALVEEAHSVVETDWLEAERLTNQALAVNPSHPTAKTILSRIVDQKRNSSVEDWVSRAQKLQSSGDLFSALAWVAEGLAVHPDDHKLLQVQDEIQRDQGARRRQNRRRDLEDLRRMESSISGAADAAAKQALAERIQGVAARYWTDGEFLSIANALLLRLGLAPQAPHGPGAPVIFHVPRPNAPKPSAESGEGAPAQVLQSKGAQVEVPQIEVRQVGGSQIDVQPNKVPQTPVPETHVPTNQVLTNPVQVGDFQPGNVSTPTVLSTSAVPSKAAQSRVPPSVVLPEKLASTTPETQVVAPQRGTGSEPPAPAANVVSPSSPPKKPVRSNSTTLILVSVSAAAVIVLAAIVFSRKHQTPPVVKAPAAAPTTSTPATSAASTPAAPTPVSSSPISSTTPTASTPAQATPEPSQPAIPVPTDSAASETAAGKVPHENQPAPESVRNVGTLLVVAGQDGASVSLDGKPQPQLTQAGQLRLPNLEPKDYLVQVSKSGFQDPAPQTIRIRKGEQAKLVFNLQPQPRLASLTIRGGDPGTVVLVDQTPVGTIQPDGTLSVSSVHPGDHTVELRKERFKPRQLKEHFIAGAAVSLAAADIALEAAPAELKITFAPPDAKVAISKGDLPTAVSSGVPLALAAGTYTLTARTADGFTRFSTFSVIAGQSKTLDLSLVPNGMSKWDDPSAWKQQGDSFIRKGGDFVLYEVAPASGTFSFSAMLTKGRLLQWVLNYTDSNNYVLCQLDENNFYRTVVRNGEKTERIIVPDKGDKKSFRILRIRVSPTELVQQIKDGNSWTVLDRWTQPGLNLSLGKFGFYIPGDDQVALAGFAHYGDLNIR
jgi:tetratricopeptide (TPR) repeat protein